MADFRAALYWSPDRLDPLAEAGHAWLGRDPERGVSVAQPPVSGLKEVTAAARVYGFHATLRPPMRLATGWAEFAGAARLVAARARPFALPALKLVDLAGFLALSLAAPCAALQELADDCVRETDPHRARPDATELARRRKGGLTAEEDALLLRWGYPQVFQCWRFHMTLTHRLNEAEMAYFRCAAEAHFASCLDVPREVHDIAIFTQREAAPFLIAERLEFSPNAIAQESG
jgi:hypothetical protein